MTVADRRLAIPVSVLECQSACKLAPSLQIGYNVRTFCQHKLHTGLVDN